MYPDDTVPNGLLILENDLVELRMRHVGFIYLYVPDGCTLLLTHILRRLVIPSVEIEHQLTYSYQNNRRPELIGWVPDTIHNLDRFNFVTCMEKFPVVEFKSYQDDVAIFGFEASENKQYVVPQNHTMVIYGPEFSPFLQDTITILFRQSDVEKCENLDAELTIKMNDTRRLMTTPPGCQLLVTSITRKVRAVRHSFREKLLRYDPGPLFLSIYSNSIRTKGNPLNFVETKADFPRLHFISIANGFRVFRRWMFNHALPKALSLVLHTAVEATEVLDEVRLTIKRKKSTCRLELYIKRMNGEEETYSQDRGFELKRLRTMKLIYRPSVLNARFEQGAQFILRSSCIVRFIKLSYKVQGGALSDEISI